MSNKKQDGKETKTADSSTQAPEEERPADMQSPILVNAQYVKDLSFENPNAPGSLRQMGQAPDVRVNVDVRARNLDKMAHEVELKISSEAKNGENVTFIVECVYAGVFTIDPEVKEEMLRPLLFIEAPRMLFPFARAIVAEAVRDGGFPPLLVHPVDFVHLYRQRMAQEQTASGESGKANGGDGAAT